MKAIYLVAILITAVFLVSGCASKTEIAATTAAQDQVQQQAAPAQTQQPAAAQSETKRFTIEGSEFKFAPNEIRINKGDNVEITFENIGTYEHNFVIEGYNKKTPIISKGNRAVLAFTADKAGTFAFFCSVPGHRASGMEGKLVVA